MPNEPNWLPIEVVIEHNRIELAETGENHFVRDRLAHSVIMATTGIAPNEAVKAFHSVKGDAALERLANLWSLHAKQA